MSKPSYQHITLRDDWLSWPAHDVESDKKFRTKNFYIFRTNSLLGNLKVVSASISSMTSVSGFLNSFLKLWIAVEIFKVWFYTLGDCFANFLSQNLIHTNGSNPWIFSIGIRRHELYAVRFSCGDL